MLKIDRHTVIVATVGPAPATSPKNAKTHAFWKGHPAGWTGNHTLKINRRTVTVTTICADPPPAIKIRSLGWRLSFNNLRAFSEEEPKLDGAAGRASDPHAHMLKINRHIVTVNAVGAVPPRNEDTRLRWRRSFNNLRAIFGRRTYLGRSGRRARTGTSTP